MSASEMKISRRLLMAGGSAFGLGLLSAPTWSQTLEKVTYLFPAPPILPAFGPIQLAQGKGYFTALSFASSSLSRKASSDFSSTFSARSNRGRAFSGCLTRT